MKYRDILFLADNGTLDITNHSLDTEASFRVYRFRRALKAKHQEILDTVADFLADVGVENALKFDEERNTLISLPERTPEQDARLAEMSQTAERFLALRSVFLEEETELSVKTISYADWKKLQDENRKDGRDPLVGYAEELLEGILWEVPED